MDKKTNDRPRRTPAQKSAPQRSAPERRTAREPYELRADRPSLASRANSLRLTYIRRVPLLYRRLIALAVPLLLLLVLAVIILPRVLGGGADRVVVDPAATNAPLADESGGASGLVWSAEPYDPAEGGDSAAATIAEVDADVDAEETVDIAAVDSGAADSIAADGDAVEEAADAFAPDESVMAAVPAATPAPATGWQSGLYVPKTRGEGYLPVFMEADRDDKVIAITVDDCYQSDNLRQIIKLAVDAGGKLTIFPIGEMIKRKSVQELLVQAHDLGFEIENHTWSHAGLYHNTDTELAKEIFNQDRAVDWVLGVNYSSHFLRPRGGDDRNDIRTHAYINQLGYYGIAHWSVCGTLSKISTLKKRLAPGQVYLFHCIDSDLALLKEFIPYAVSQGYQLVTMNELFGYEKNAEEPLTDDPKTRAIPPLEPYARDYSRKLKAPTYEYISYEVQVKLIELGLLEGKPDGIYGPGTAASAAKWQSSKGYTADGVLTGAQLKELLEG